MRTDRITKETTRTHKGRKNNCRKKYIHKEQKGERHK